MTRKTNRKPRRKAQPARKARDYQAILLHLAVQYADELDKLNEIISGIVREGVKP